MSCNKHKIKKPNHEVESIPKKAIIIDKTITINRLVAKSKKYLFIIILSIFLLKFHLKIIKIKCSPKKTISSAHILFIEIIKYENYYFLKLHNFFLYLVSIIQTFYIN